MTHFYCNLQLQKLGLLIPFEAITGQFLRHYQEIWANNGDIISKQYTGTVAMKVNNIVVQFTKTKTTILLICHFDFSN